MKLTLLKFILGFKAFWNKFGVDTQQAHAILETKLKMDSRRESSFNYKKSGRETNYTDAILAFFYFLFGVFGLMIFITFKHFESAMSVYLSFWMILLLITLITDFTEVLIDVRDNYIILPTPINNNTLTVSRLLHLVIYLSGLVIPFALPTLIYLSIKVGILTAVVLIFQITLSLFVAILAVNIIYMVLLNFTSAQKFKEIINYFQIVFSVIVFGSYYVIPRLITPEFGQDLNINNHWWNWLLPGRYLASINSLIGGEFQILTITKAIIGILLPLICLYLIIYKFGHNFSQKLLSLSSSGDSSKNVEKEITEGSDSKLMQFWEGLFIKNPIESAYFKFSWFMTGRSRLFKLRTYPLFGFLPAFFIYMAFSDKIEVNRMTDLQNSNNDIFMIYLVVFGTLTPLLNSKYSENFKARSIFKALPISKPGYIIRGNLKAIFFKFGIPMYIFALLAMFGIWGLQTWSTAIVGFVNIIFCMLSFTFLFQKNMPYSEPWENQSKGSNTTTAFLLMFIISVVGFGHWFLRDNIAMLMVYTLAVTGLSAFIYAQFPKIEWKSLE